MVPQGVQSCSCSKTVDSLRCAFLDVVWVWQVTDRRGGD